MNTVTHLIASWPPDHSLLIGASFVLATAALALVFTLWVNRRLYERQPRLLSLAVWLMIAAITAAIVEGMQ